jgi:hypothetical protein
VHALLLLPITLIVVITVVDMQAPTNIHLGPTLVIAPRSPLPSPGHGPRPPSERWH